MKKDLIYIGIIALVSVLAGYGNIKIMSYIMNPISDTRIKDFIVHAVYVFAVVSFCLFAYYQCKIYILTTQIKYGL